MARTQDTGGRLLPQGWQEKNRRLVSGYKFRDFAQAMAFLTEVGLRAEVAEHHPDFSVHYNEVRFEVWSHDANAVTDRDYKLVAQIATAATRHGATSLS